MFNSRKLNIAVGLLLIIMIVAIGRWHFANSIKNNGVIVKGEIKRIERTTGKNSRNEYVIGFYFRDFYLEVSKYIPVEECSYEYSKKNVIGNYLFLKFDTTDISNNEVFVVKSQYDENKLEYPLFLDSLYNCYQKE